MPVIGYQNLLYLRYSEPQAFHTLMLGARSWLFDLVAPALRADHRARIWYMLRAVRSSSRADSADRLILPVSLAVLVVTWLVFAMPYQVQHVPVLSRLTDAAINPLGKMQPNKYFAAAALVFFGLLNWILFLRSFAGRSSWWKTGLAGGQDRASQKILIVIAGCAMLTMVSMGWVRERARAYNGYLIYGVMTLADERATYEGRSDP